jgi:4-amino-4-deoxy-L-arabinose transferase-like glycosyltransferase
MNKGLKPLIIIAILLLAGFLRLWQLDKVPPSPSLDEVSIGYNAYSILTTGKDEYGTRLSVLLRAYDDWRPALYVYLVAPFVRFFGLSAFAVRFPSILLSLITILTTYFLVKELFKNSSLAIHYSLFTIFLLAISPWHIYISRLGHEVNTGLAFVVLGFFFFLKWVYPNTLVYRTKVIWLILAVFFLSLSFYTYQSEKLFVPLMIIALGLIFKKQLGKFKKEIILAGLLGLVLLVPILKTSLSPERLIRFKGTSIFYGQQEPYQRASLRITRDYQQGDILGLIFDNRRVAMGVAVLRAYFSHFDPSWLFFNTGEEKHKVPDLGVLYLWELPLLFVGSYKLATGRFSKESRLLIFSWILIAPLPASIATEAPHAMRTFNILPMPQVLTAIGMVAITTKIQSMTQKYLRYLIFTLCFFFLLFNFYYLYHNYFVNFPYEQSESFQYSLTRAIPYVLDIEDKYQRIVFSNQSHLYQSYMFFLFFSQYDPFVYLNQGGTISGGHNETHKIGKYEFRPIDWRKEKKERNTLYIGNVNEFPEEVVPLAIFKLLDNQKAIKVVVGK